VGKGGIEVNRDEQFLHSSPATGTPRIVHIIERWSSANDPSHARSQNPGFNIMQGNIQQGHNIHLWVYFCRYACGTQRVGA
jgi:hypothetical protein